MGICFNLKEYGHGVINTFKKSKVQQLTIRFNFTQEFSNNFTQSFSYYSDRKTKSFIETERSILPIKSHILSAKQVRDCRHIKLIHDYS